MKKVNGTEMEKVAIKLMDKFNKENCWYDSGIYVNGKAYYSNVYKPMDVELHCTPKGTKYYVRNNIDAKKYIEYANPNTITVFFEGNLYRKINYEDYDYIYKLTEKYLKPYGLYFEQGDAWNMSAF